MIHENPRSIEALAALIRELDGSHSMGAAALAEALIERGVMLQTTGEQFAVAARLDDGTIAPISKPFEALADAESDLSTLLGDDYYRDRQPFIASASLQVWRRVDLAAVRQK